MRAVIADTGPLYAAFDPGDQYHTQSQAELQQLDQENLAIIILYPTILEAYSLVLQRFDTQLALMFLESLVAGAELINPTINDYLAAQEKVVRYPDQRITLFDALAATVAIRLKLPVWTYDYHFDIMQIQVWR